MVYEVVCGAKIVWSVGLIKAKLFISTAVRHLSATCAVKYR